MRYYMDIDNFIKNPSKGETYDDVEKTIANQMARFTSIFTNSKNPVEDLKIVCALGFDLWKTCGPRVCEDTNMTLTHIVNKTNPSVTQQFQQIANNLNNNDVCVYLYLALPTINNNLSLESIKGLCNNTIDKIAVAYGELRYPFRPNFSGIDTSKVKSLYQEYLNGLV
jgi:hypothetical protein